MSLWEYKVITSGKGGFATPVLLEKFLNDLGRDEWEIVQFHSHPDNFLAFTGLARRTTQRDWTLQDAAAAAAKAEAEKLRAEFEAKFKAASAPAPASGGGDERAPSFLEEKAAPDDGFRKPVDTSRDDDPEAHGDDKGEDDWDKLTAAEEDELPTFFEAMKPHMRRNQRGPGMSVGVDYLAKKWDQSEDDIRGALVECGFILPADEDSKPEYVEYEGDLYWLNINRRGELWINTKEKPRPVFRAVKAQRIAVEEEPARAPAAVFTPTPKAAVAEAAAGKPESGDRTPASAEAPAGEPETAGAAAESSASRNPPSAVPSAPLPPGAELLAKIRPHMRRNRRGPGGSGSTSFLGRALRATEADLKSAFVALGLTVPTSAADKPVYVELDGDVWWLNLDSRGGLWINGREKKPGESLAAPAPADASAPAAGSEPVAPAAAADSGAAPTIGIEPAPEPAAAPAPVAAPTSNSPLAAVRLLLKETKTGAIAAKAERVAEELGKSVDDLVATLVGAGLVVPEKAREKPVFVEHAGEIFWFNRNAKGELWLNAKASKFADKADGDEAGDAKKPVRRGRAKKAE